MGLMTNFVINNAKAKLLFDHAESYGDVDWSEISTSQFKREIKVWIQEIQSGVFN
jgi:hypothetical protein